MSGARVYFTMAHDNLFFRRAGTLDPVHRTPVFALAIQCLWTILLTLSGQYSDLLDYVIFAVLLFYILTSAASFDCAARARIWNAPTAPWATPCSLPCTCW